MAGIMFARVCDGIDTLRKMIDKEAECWMERGDSKTVANIKLYSTNLGMLQNMGLEKSAKGFFYVFEKKKIFVDGIRDFFRVTHSSTQTQTARKEEKLRVSKLRSTAEFLFDQVCAEFLSTMELESMKERADGWGSSVTFESSQNLVKDQRAKAKVAMQDEEDFQKQATAAGNNVTPQE